MSKLQLKKRFQGYLPVVIDVETGGVNPEKDALLEIAAVLLDYDDQNCLVPVKTDAYHVMPFAGGNLDPRALAINQIDPYHPFRFAIDEGKALSELYQLVEQHLTHTGCRRAVLVGHNAHFDLNFLMAASKRAKIKKIPFHAFTCFDTATLGGLIYGRTVLAKALEAANIPYDKNEAHSAIYDAERTAELFCKIINNLK